MKRFVTSIVVIFSAICMMAQSQEWPANYGGVMLQGFYWDSFSETSWKKLEKQANQFAGTFDLVWIPQSGYSGYNSMGYDDMYWFPGEGRYNSSFGAEIELRSMINTFKDKGIGTIADVVISHRKNVSSWFDFSKEIARQSGINSCDIKPCHSVEFPSPVSRPSYSVLDKTKFKNIFGINIPYWTDSLAVCLSNLNN